MDNPNNVVEQELSLVLSQEELFLILRLMNLQEMVGFRFTVAKGSEQHDWALIHAEHSLRARDLAQIDSQGNLEIRQAVMMLVATCAFAQRTIVLSQFEMPDGQPFQVFAHASQGEYVLHQIPEPPLHRFTAYPEKGGLVTSLLDHSGCKTLVQIDLPQFELSRDLLADTREKIEHGELEQALSLLEQAGLSSIIAQTLCDTLKGTHQISVFHNFYRLQDGNLIERSISILHSSDTAWLVVDTEEGQKQIFYPISSDNLAQALESWL